ncbi:putative anti-sigma F factor antagonist [Clostridium sp. CAG:921]|nr:putative anti-sigma F factor antagonist [Clostridium sp. CAG:921]
MKYEYGDGKLKIDLDEEIDINSCKNLRAIIDGYIMKYQPKEFIMNLSNVSFMDSSGIGLLIGRYNLLKLMDANMTILNPTQNIKRVLELSKISSNITMRSE